MTFPASSSCNSCQRALAVTETLYTEGGDPICETCIQRRQASASLQKSAELTRGLALGNPLLGLASFFFNPLFLISAGAIGNGLYALKKARSDASRGEGSAKTGSVKVAAIIGMALGAASVALQLFG